MSVEAEGIGGLDRAGKEGFKGKLKIQSVTSSTLI